MQIASLTTCQNHDQTHALPIRAKFIAYEIYQKAHLRPSLAVSDYLSWPEDRQQKCPHPDYSNEGRVFLCAQH